MPGIHLDCRAEPRVQRQLTIYGIELEPDGQPLHDLDPIAGRVLGWQSGELRAGPGGSLPPAKSTAAKPGGKFASG